MQKHLTRIKTGFLLGVLAIASVFYFPDVIFAVLLGILVSLAFWEWLVLISVRFWLNKVILLIGFWIITILMLHHLWFSLQLTLLWWVAASILIFVPAERLSFLKNKGLQFLLAVLNLGPLWISIVTLHEVDRTVLFYLIMLVCFADTAAYFVGSHYGKHKLMPTISPKKSVEGLLGGLIVGTIAGMGVVLFMPNLSFEKALGWLVFGIFLIFVSVLGDLFESLMKRLYDAKDSGSLLPGHGGFLDRVDSLASSFPIYLLFLIVFGVVQVHLS